MPVELPALYTYDGVTRRYRHADTGEQAAIGRAFANRELRVSDGEQAAADGLRYDLLYESGGAGVLDRVAIVVAGSTADAAARAAARLGLATPTTLLADPQRADAIRWLLGLDDGDRDGPPPTLPVALEEFVDDEVLEEQEFVPRYVAGDPSWLAPSSDVNSWTLLYLREATLVYLRFDQG